MDEFSDREKSHAFICPHCENLALAMPHGVTVIPDRNPSDPEDIYGPPVECTLVQCNNCAEVSVRGREDYGNGFTASEYFNIFPEPRRLNSDIPLRLRQGYDEAKTCFSAKAFTATVVMVRRTLEGTCKLNGVKGKTLHAGLRELKENGLINETLSEWANALRVVGNQGAHFSEQNVSRDDAEDSLAFLEAFLEHIYVLQKRFQEFMDRRTGKSQSAGDA